MVPVKRLTLLVHEHYRPLSLQHDHHVPQHHPTVHASFFVVMLFSLFCYETFTDLAYRNKGNTCDGDQGSCALPNYEKPRC